MAAAPAIRTFGRATSRTGGAGAAARDASRSEGEAARFICVATAWLRSSRRVVEAAAPVPRTMRVAARTVAIARRISDASPPGRNRVTPVTLTWRAAGDDASGPRERASPAAVFASNGASATSHDRAPAGLAGTATQREGATHAASAAGATIDASTANRLVDDVIRRIEKRARIERERSGM